MGLFFIASEIYCKTYTCIYIFSLDAFYQHGANVLDAFYKLLLKKVIKYKKKSYLLY
jgi:hypothetical protein